MNESENNQLTVINEIELLRQLQVYCPTLATKQAHKFIYTWCGARLEKIDEPVVDKFIKLLLAEICLMYGLSVYDEQNESMMYNFHIASVKKFVTEGFYFLTTAEIQNAFHLNLRGAFGKDVIKQYGKEVVNCEFIGQVLSAYVEYKEKFINRNPDLIKVIHPSEQPAITEQKEQTEEDLKNADREYLQHQYFKFITDPNWNYKLLNPSTYTTLLVDHIGQLSDYKDFVNEAKSELVVEKRKAQAIPTSLERLDKPLEDGSVGSILEKHFDLEAKYQSEMHTIRLGAATEVHVLAKQKAILSFFKRSASKGLKNIYVQQ